MLHNFREAFLVQSEMAYGPGLQLYFTQKLRAIDVPNIRSMNEEEQYLVIMVLNYVIRKRCGFSFVPQTPSLEFDASGHLFCCCARPHGHRPYMQLRALKNTQVRNKGVKLGDIWYVSTLVYIQIRFTLVLKYGHAFILFSSTACRCECSPRCTWYPLLSCGLGLGACAALECCPRGNDTGVDRHGQTGINGSLMWGPLRKSPISLALC